MEPDYTRKGAFHLPGNSASEELFQTFVMICDWSAYIPRGTQDWFMEQDHTSSIRGQMGDLESIVYCFVCKIGDDTMAAD